MSRLFPGLTDTVAMTDVEELPDSASRTPVRVKLHAVPIAPVPRAGSAITTDPEVFATFTEVGAAKQPAAPEPVTAIGFEAA
jgi:hypothetical protein